MKIGITGLPGSGKSTVFGAITRLKRKEEGYQSGVGGPRPHLGAVKVPDPRIDELGRIFNSKKITNIEITFSDLPGFNVSHLGDGDALVWVIGTFYSKNPVKDIEEIEASLLLRDLEVLEHRLPQMAKEMRSGKEEVKREFDVLSRCKDLLSKDTPLRSLELKEEEEKLIRGYQFLSKKPVLLVGNVAETDIEKGSPKSMLDHVAKKKLNIIEFCGKTEFDILEVREEEREGFLKEMGIDITARDKFVKAAFDLLNLITFFTVKGDEARAWTVPKGTSALEAAGKVHTDMKRGFIRAEVVNCKDLMECGGRIPEARNRGLLKLEGKDYVVNEADILDIRFNI